MANGPGGMCLYSIIQHDTAPTRLDKARSTVRHARGSGRAQMFRHINLKSTARLEVGQNTVREKACNKHNSLVGSHAARGRSIACDPKYIKVIFLIKSKNKIL